MKQRDSQKRIMTKKRKLEWSCSITLSGKTSYKPGALIRQEGRGSLVLDYTGHCGRATEYFVHKETLLGLVAVSLLASNYSV